MKELGVFGKKLIVVGLNGVGEGPIFTYVKSAWKGRSWQYSRDDNLGVILVGGTFISG